MRMLAKVLMPSLLCVALGCGPPEGGKAEVPKGKVIEKKAWAKIQKDVNKEGADMVKALQKHGVSMEDYMVSEEAYRDK